MSKENGVNNLFFKTIGDRLRLEYTSEFGYEVILSKECDSASGCGISLYSEEEESDEETYMCSVSALLRQEDKLLAVVVISSSLSSGEEIVSKFFSISLSSGYKVFNSVSKTMESDAFSNVLLAHIVDTSHLSDPFLTPKGLRELAYQLDLKYANEQVSRYRLYLINGASDESGIADCISELGIA
jgi:hypothetical protein